MTDQTRTLLLVEDSEDDVFLMRRALRKANIQLPLHVVMDGQEALDYLGGVGKFKDRSQFPIPLLVFLDLKLPYVHGFEVLQWIRQHETLSTLPVVVLTSSPEERDRQQAHQLGAKAYYVKPPQGEALVQAVDAAMESKSPDIAAPSP
ncbi:MAG TPA: response regulator [Verrucomicrobiae bacterium]|nr:response regulator [Verrucomicrobiae bacterium]